MIGERLYKGISPSVFFPVAYLQHPIILQQHIPSLLKGDIPQQRLVVPSPEAVQGLSFWRRHVLAVVVAVAAVAGTSRRKRSIFDHGALQAVQGPVLFHLLLVRPFRQMQHTQAQLSEGWWENKR